MKKHLAMSVGAAVLMAAGMARAGTIIDTEGNLQLTITSQGVPDNTNGDNTGGSASTVADGWTAFAFVLTSLTPSDGVNTIGGNGAGANAFSGVFLQQYDLKQTVKNGTLAQLKYYHGNAANNSSVGVQDTNDSVNNWPNTSTTGQYAVDSHWLIADQNFAPISTLNVTAPFESGGPAVNASYVNNNPWGNNGVTGLVDDTPFGTGTKVNTLGEAWDTNTGFGGSFAISGAGAQTLELIYLIIPTSGVGTYSFGATDVNNPSNIENFGGTFSVPEPAALTLLGGAGMVFMGTGRKRKTAAKTA